MPKEYRQVMLDFKDGGGGTVVSNRKSKCVCVEEKTF